VYEVMGRCGVNSMKRKVEVGNKVDTVPEGNL